MFATKSKMSGSRARSRSAPSSQTAGGKPIQRQQAAGRDRKSSHPTHPKDSFGGARVQGDGGIPGVSGRPLDDDLRLKMETAFETDLSDVRVHEDPTADEIDAIAYTRGRRIHFAPGAFRPNSAAGQEIIGHELTHVIQQRRGRVDAPSEAERTIDEDPRLEGEAERLGRRAAEGKPAAIDGGSAAGQPVAALAGSGAPIQRAKKRKAVSASSDEEEESESSESEKESEEDEEEEEEEERPAEVERLARSHQRNLLSKAKPAHERSNYEGQQKHNYGYDEPEIDEGLVKASFRRGYGGQPFFSMKKEDYGGAVVASDYDALASKLAKGGDAEKETAQDILDTITSGGDLDATKYTDEERRAAATLSGLTQFIEPHSTRIPSTDKYARASLRRIAEGDSTFKREFNRKSGNFVPARAKKGGSKFGGQEATRALLGMGKERDTATFEDVYNSDVGETLKYLSSSSEEEGSSSEESDSEEEKRKKRKRTW